MNEPKMNQNDYQEVLNSFRHKFTSLEYNQSEIERKSEEVMNTIVSEPSITNDLIQLWGEKCKERGKHQIPLLLLADHIIQNSFSNKLELHEHFWWFIRKVFPSLYMTLNITLRNEIDKIIGVWEEKSIYSQEKLDELKFLLKFETLPKIKGGPLESEILFNLITSNKLKIDENLVEFTKALYVLKKTGENKQREKVLKLSSEIIEKQNKTYNQHLSFLKETDKMLDKIQAYKDMNHNFAEENNNNNNNNSSSNNNNKNDY